MMVLHTSCQPHGGTTIKGTVPTEHNHDGACCQHHYEWMTQEHQQERGWKHCWIAEDNDCMCECPNGKSKHVLNALQQDTSVTHHHFIPIILLEGNILKPGNPYCGLLT
jgi:hypothetical protein